jgi:cytochrome c oxidase cbb3-type subunit III
MSVRLITTRHKYSTGYMAPLPSPPPRGGRVRVGVKLWRAVLGVQIVGIAALTMFALAGCDAMPGRPRQADRPPLASEVTAFTALYGQNCAGCHGADGRLGPARPLNDPIYLALVPRERLRTIIAQGVPNTAMPAFSAGAGGALTEAQLDALVSDMVTRWSRPALVQGLTLPPYDAAEAVANGSSSPGNPEQGREVYAAACADCHGADGRGGRKGGSVVDAAYLALVSDQALRTAVIAGRPDLEMPDWRGDIPGRPLTPQQIADIVAWLISHRVAVVGRLSPGVGAGRQ